MITRRGPRTRRRNKRKYAQGKKAVAICDRSGFKHRIKDMVIEPGTGLFVHKSWSDGMWNRVDHPQNFPADTSENISLENPRPDLVVAEVPLLRDENGDIILGPDGIPLFAE